MTELTELLYNHIQRNERFECCLIRIYLSLFRSCLIVCRCLRSGVTDNVMDQTKISTGRPAQSITPLPIVLLDCQPAQ